MRVGPGEVEKLKSDLSGHPSIIKIKKNSGYIVISYWPAPPLEISDHLGNCRILISTCYDFRH